jgi:hypothetical protein
MHYFRKKPKQRGKEAAKTASEAARIPAIHNTQVCQTKPCQPVKTLT